MTKHPKPDPKLDTEMDEGYAGSRGSDPDDDPPPTPDHAPRVPDVKPRPEDGPAKT